MRITKKIGIFYIDESWANEVFEEIVKWIPSSWIIYRRVIKGKRFCALNDGGTIETINAVNKNNVRGKKVELAIEQEGLDKEVQEEIWFGCVHHPFDRITIKDVEELERL